MLDLDYLVSPSGYAKFHAYYTHAISLLSSPPPPGGYTAMMKEAINTDSSSLSFTTAGPAIAPPPVNVSSQPGSQDERITAIADLDEDVPNLGDDDKDSEDTTKDLAGNQEKGIDTSSKRKGRKRSASKRKVIDLSSPESPVNKQPVGMPSPSPSKLSLRSSDSKNQK